MSPRPNLCVEAIAFDIPTRGIAIVVVFARAFWVHCDNVVSIYVDVIGELILLLLARSSVVKPWKNKETNLLI